MATIEPTLPFHLARAYGVQPPVRPSPVVTTVPRTTAIADSVSKPDVASVRERLVAAVVPGRVDFSGTEPAQSMSFYRHPADRNAAATGVQAGRVIDVTG
ncbi:MAG: hypothetical protein ACKVW3_11570 [Phycisphaerales bacterium]